MCFTIGCLHLPVNNWEFRSCLNMIFGIGFTISISFVLYSLKRLLNFPALLSGGWYTLTITILHFCICIELVFDKCVRFCNQLFCINCFGCFDVGYCTPILFMHFFISVHFSKWYGQCIFIICQFRYLLYFVLLFLCVWVPGCCNWLLSISLFAPGSWSWTNHCHHVVQLLLIIVHHFL